MHHTYTEWNYAPKIRANKELCTKSVGGGKMELCINVSFIGVSKMTLHFFTWNYDLIFIIFKIVSPYFQVTPLNNYIMVNFNLQNYFHSSLKLCFAHPVCKMKLLVIHEYSFYGSSLWDLYCNACNHLYTTWNIAVHILYELPRTAYTRLLCNITNLPHIKYNLKCRFIKFVNNATKSLTRRLGF